MSNEEPRPHGPNCFIYRFATALLGVDRRGMCSCGADLETRVDGKRLVYFGGNRYEWRDPKEEGLSDPFARPITAKSLASESERDATAYRVYIGWCMAKKIHYTEVWYPLLLEEFVNEYNAEVERRK